MLWKPTETSQVRSRLGCRRSHVAGVVTRPSFAHPQPIARLTGHTQLINHVAFSPDGRWLASASFDKSIKLWSGADGVFVATLRGHVGAVYQV